ncbi:MAG: hypothetical protein HZA51_10610 [Planctomycetes bacterium]|nr:hypothetical protein [Planctomycetota bacterium]
MDASARRNWFRRHRTKFWRALWAIVLVCHAPLTINAFGSLLGLAEGRASGSSLLLLAASNAFFVLEILFACSLQLLSSRRNAIVFVLIVVLLHTGVFENRLPSAVTDSQFVYCLILTAIGAADWRRLLSLATRAARFITSVLVPENVRPYQTGNRGECESLLRPRPIRSYLSIPPRAPPLSIC